MCLETHQELKVRFNMRTEMKCCTIELCCKKHEAKGFCKKHYHQFLYYGEIPNRTRNDLNDFIIDGDICWIILRDNKCKEKARAKFLTVYYDQICKSNLIWHLKNGYVSADWSDENGKHQISLHQAIIQLSGQIVQPGEEIDHKDGDGLNNLDDNLRICTHVQNSHNQGKHKNNTSGLKGVSWYKKINKWESYIGYNGRQEHLGYFNTKEDAARAYNVVAAKYFGEFAVLNEI